MKRLSTLLLLAFFALACGDRESQTPSKGAPGELSSAKTEPFVWKGKGPNERFYSMAKALDTGGDLFCYFDLADYARTTLDSLDSGPPQPSISLFWNVGMPIVKSAVATLGVWNLSDVGLSAVRDGHFYRTKAYLRGPEEKPRLLRVFGPPARPMAALAYAPVNTVFLSAIDLDLTETQAAAQEILNNAAGGPFAQVFAKQLLEANLGAGIDSDALIRSLGTEFALIVAVDSDNRLAIRSPNASTTETYAFPTPRFAFLAEAKDAMLYEALERVLRARKGAVVDDSTGSPGDAPIKRLEFTFENATPLAAAPALAYDGRFVFFASHGSFLDELFGTQESGESLASEKEYRLLTQGMSQECNGVTYMAYYLGDEIRRLLEWRAAQEGAPKPAERSGNAQALLELLRPTFGGFASKRINEPDGIRVVTQQSAAFAPDVLAATSGPGALIAASGLAPLGIVAALASPEWLEPQRWAELLHAQEPQQ